MFILNLKSLSDNLNSVCINDVSVDSIHSLIYERCHIDRGKYFLKSNGRIVNDSDDIGGIVEAVPKLRGGKGGFGSMLRAIGAQIEKTTNREACRDLSGRRLRDINEEQRLKKWIAQQAEREKEREEKRKKKLEKLAKVVEPKHEFKDEIYDAERADLTEKISDAVEQGFNTSVKRKNQEPVLNNNKNKKKKLILDLEEDLSSDENSSNEDSGPSSSGSSQKNFSSDETKVKPKKTLMDDDFSSSSEDESNQK